ncbi:Type II secretion system protein E [Candidatus Rhabdochlamydia oedothoracis]|uniref:protein-secreting ATPase n=1 Tax=Candidatus Rhabdochlamydia oedothoracis TaxID=2720720 RepID=A0ABX8UYN2_9BACT|nr:MULTISPECIES: type II secretion system ATPase GspE [Rhabdochlamydia]KAG6559892.1 Type II secretion system protein E [Candidatus Rhabdochlamydia sp. W815]MCL6755689.1 type II secretion system ATPase GspE [Candidatus Rhabdochlamydia oedothoracis]QYF48034.1 Type II secretion system protein E [Candidatus Rhabdochlamydia oedothoracis]
MAMLTGFLAKLSGLFTQREPPVSLVKARSYMGNVEEKAKELEIAFYADLLDFFCIKNKISPLSYSFIRKNQLVILEEQRGKWLIAMLNPFDLEALEQVRFITQKDTQVVFTTQVAFEKAIEQLFHQKENEASEYIASLQQNQESCLEDQQEGYDLLESVSEVPVIHLLNVILAEAVQQDSSDIHFEPTEQGLEVRYRLDGVLHMRHTPPLELQTQLITRIKVLARLDIAEHRLPQDGRIKLHMGQRQIDFRVSTVPVAFGERIVLRILDKNNVSLGLDKIGMDPVLLSAFNKLIRLSEGIVLVTGPTGSGKTTTLYSALSEINSSEMNIMTIEDPVEYKLPGMAQIGVNPRIHLNFATGLRHILRQDPDVIMIGEIRDKETAEIAIQSALTGHLVFSTLHTNDAPSALTRLVDMGIEPYLLSSSVLGVLAQRLVRRVCPHCSVLYQPFDQELKEIGLSKSEVKEGLYRGAGCEVCYGSGFKGRHAIYELMYVDHLVRQQLLLSADATTLQKVALAQGMSSLRQQGAVLVQKGITTTSEVLRVTKILELG